MSSSSDEGETTMLSPDEAFSILGNETRIEILQTLGEAGYGESLPFSELRDRVGIRRGGEFNYHLDKLVGHFVTKTDAGYALRPAGHRVVEAVLSETVTGDPDLEPVELDYPCPYCGSPTEVDFHQQRLHQYCSECSGTYDHTALPSVSVDPQDRGYLGMLNVPPTGIVDRDPGEVVEAATMWHHLLFLNAANGLCPRCSAALDSTADVCTDHDPSDGLCVECGFRHVVRIKHRCRKCTFHVNSGFADWLLTNLDFVTFLVEHGVNPISPKPENQQVWMDHDVEVLSMEPFEAQFTFTIDDDALTLTIDDDLNVIDVKQRAASDAT